MWIGDPSFEIQNGNTVLCKQVIRMNFLQQRSPQGTDGTNFEMSLRTVNKTFL